MANLFYDKYSGDLNGNGNHHYGNTATNDVTIEDLNDGSYEYYTRQRALNYYNKIFESKKDFTLPECTYTSNMFKLKLYVKTQGITTIFVVIEVNVDMLKDMVKNKQPIPPADETFLKDLCRFHMAYHETLKFYSEYTKQSTDIKIKNNLGYITKTANDPVNYTFNNRIVNPTSLNLNLYEYQKCSVYWMIERENNKKIISYNLNNEVVLGDVFYDINMRKFNMMEDKKKLKFYGGCIIDEVGLGKTLQVVSLGLLKPSTHIGYTNDLHPNKFVSKATLILCPNQLCGQWLREVQTQVKPESKIKILSIMTKRDFDKLTYKELLDADFVLLSYTFLDNKNFVNIWSKGISTFSNFHKKQWNDADSYKVSELFKKMGSDLLLKQTESLASKQPLIQLIHWHRIVIDEFHEIYKDNTTFMYINNMLKQLSADNKWVVTATPFNTNICIEKIFDFLTDYKNVDSRNIFVEEQITEHLAGQVFRRNTKDSVKLEHTLPPIQEELHWLKFSPTERMMYNAYLANTNNDKYGTYLRQLCCHPQLANETKDALSNCKTLADIEKMMVLHYKKEVDEAQEKVNEQNAKLTKYNKKLRKLERKQKKRAMKKQGLKVSSDTDSDDDSNDSDSDSEDDKVDLVAAFNGGPLNLEPTVLITTYKDMIKNAVDKLNELTTALTGKTNTHDFFVNVVERIRKTSNKDSSNKVIDYDNIDLNELMNASSSEEDENAEEEDDPCGICLGEIPEHDIGVTRCGHMFCYSCLKGHINKHSSCPYCRTKLSEKDTYVLSYEMKKKTTDDPAEKNKINLINEIGTKLANLILYLRETDQHTIIFSQWDDLLLRVGRILKENGIKNVFCKGNCYQRDKAIREFNTDDKIKVIMLSSGSTAAGTNLTKATRVIFIDPIYGDYKFRKDQERQAVGRAHRLGQKSQIKIVRFIIKESIEEEIYNINCEEDKKHGTQVLNMNEIDVV